MLGSAVTSVTPRTRPYPCRDRAATIGSESDDADSCGAPAQRLLDDVSREPPQHTPTPSTSGGRSISSRPRRQAARSVIGDVAVRALLVTSVQQTRRSPVMLHRPGARGTGHPLLKLASPRLKPLETGTLSGLALPTRPQTQTAPCNGKKCSVEPFTMYTTPTWTCTNQTGTCRQRGYIIHVHTVDSY